MIKIYWTEILGKKSQIVFLIYLPSYHFVIKAFGFLPGNKRRGTPRSKFLHPLIIELEVMSGEIGLESFASFEITEEELVKWIGRVRLDQVPSLDDIGWIMKVKKDIEAKIKIERV